MQIGRLFRTLRFIKPIQAVYQVKGRLAKVKPLINYSEAREFNISGLTLIPLPETKFTADSGNKFTFLNLTHQFTEIDWNYQVYGKLWNYNLQYFDFINQENISEQIRISWLKQLYQSLFADKIKPEPYPISLRIMNVIRFFSSDITRVKKYNEILNGLYSEIAWLNDNYEYHLLGNHLLENAFAMLMGGHFFNNEVWKTKADKILADQLKEQVLNDGVHFELSPMYHQIILYRTLEAISYLPDTENILNLMREKASAMLGWLMNVTFRNGDIPHFNDSADGIAFNSGQLLSLAEKINIKPIKINLSDSGYRKFETGSLELVADVHGISPNYQPGHSHADHLSFILYVKGKPFIVDPGTSTYNISERRQWERSSRAHNTVTINNKDQSEVWSGFRVGRRAQVKIFKDNFFGVSASVEYSSIKHVREFAVTENNIIINDCVDTRRNAVARFYLDPLTSIIKSSTDTVIFDNGVVIRFLNARELKIEDYDMAAGFNNLLKSKVIEVYFTHRFTTTILCN